MNKLLIVFLAVALVSVHAFVKRDAPAAGDVNYAEQIKNNFLEMKTKFDEELKKALDPEETKKKFSEFVDQITKTINDLQPKETPK